jgi:hypothetical protein
MSDLSAAITGAELLEIYTNSRAGDKSPRTLERPPAKCIVDVDDGTVLTVMHAAEVSAST